MNLEFNMLFLALKCLLKKINWYIKYNWENRLVYWRSGRGGCNEYYKIYVHKKTNERVKVTFK